MNKKQMGLSLACFAVFGFILISLQYKVTELSLKIPALEEAYHQKKQLVQAKELQARQLKNPKILFEKQQKDAVCKLVFPKYSDVYAIDLSSTAKTQPSEKVLSSTPNLPIAKVFP